MGSLDLRAAVRLARELVIQIPDAHLCLASGPCVYASVRVCAHVCLILRWSMHMGRLGSAEPLPTS